MRAFKDALGFCAVIGFAGAAVGVVVYATFLAGGTAGATPMSSSVSQPEITGADTCEDALPKVRLRSLDNDIYTLRKDGVAVANSKERINGDQVIIVGPPLLPGESASYSLTVAVPDDSSMTVTTLEVRDVTRPTRGYCTLIGRSMPDYYNTNGYLE